VDAVIEELLSYLEPGDLLIDGGNSHFPDTNRRTKSLAEKGFLYMGWVFPEETMAPAMVPA